MTTAQLDTLEMVYNNALLHGISVYHDTHKTEYGYESVEISLMYCKTRFSRGKYQWCYLTRISNNHHIVIKEEVSETIDSATLVIFNWLNDMEHRYSIQHDFNLDGIYNITDFVKMFNDAGLTEEE